MPLTIRFRLRSSTDHSSPATGAPAVQFWTPGAGWFTPAGNLSGQGGGVWSQVATAADVSGGDPLLVYAAANDSDPFWDAYFPNGSTWTAGSGATPFPVWIGTSASGGFLPDVGTTPQAQVSLNGATMGPAAGGFQEPGGPASGRGWYLYIASAAEVAQPGDLLLVATSSDGFAWSYDYPIAAAPVSPAAPTTTPDAPPQPPIRDRNILDAMKRALDDTGLFDQDGVFLWGFADSSGSGSDRTRAAAILPLDGAEEDRYDGVDYGQMFQTSHAKIAIMARDEDQQVRDEAAGRLLEACKNALNGRALVPYLGDGVIYPQWTKIQRWSWSEPEPPQRKIEAVFQYVIDAPTWVSFDTSE